MLWLGPAFVSLLGAQLGVRFWLARRQIAAVMAHRAAVPEACRRHVSPEAHARAAAYTAARTRLVVAGALVEAATTLALTFGGGIAWVDAELARAGLGPLWHGVLVVVAVSLILVFSRLPLMLWRVFGLEARFGFNRATPALFARDFAKRLVLAGAVLVPAALVVIEAMHGTRWWWLVAWLVWVAITVGTTWAWARLVAPLFNRFTPLTGPLAERVAMLLKACGFENDGLFVMDGSRRSSHGNAYFSGIGSGKRIVLFDTLLARLSTDEIEAVLAHELGHFRLGHVQWRLAATLAGSFALFAIAGVLAARPEFYAALGVPVPSAQAALLLFALLLPVAGFWAGPVLAAWSRRHEYEADRFAAGHASSEALAEALIKLHRDNAATLTPDRVYSAFYDSHPALFERLRALSSG